jgi:hypothetical protein
MESGAAGSGECREGKRYVAPLRANQNRAELRRLAVGHQRCRDNE